MNFESQLKEMIDIIKQILESFSDEELEERSETILNQMNQHLSGPEANVFLNEIIRQIDLEGQRPEQVLAELNSVQEIIYNAIGEVKALYPNSPVKQAFCDMFASIIESYLLRFVGMLANRDSVNVGIELIHPNAKLPTYAHPGDQGADLYAIKDMIIEPNTYGNVIPTGIRAAIPHDWAISIRPRSGLSKNSTLRISNSPATIDQQYRGEIKVLMDNVGFEPVIIKAGDRIAQMVLERNYQAKYHVVDSVDVNTERGTGGFGSSGN